MSNWNDAAQEVTIAAARLQGAVATGSDINVMSEAKRLAYRLGDLIECVTGRKFAGLDMERAVTLIRFSGEGAELAVKEVSL
jgi:hypothetical protein